MKPLFALFAAICAFAVFTPSALQAGDFRLDIRIGSGGGHGGTHCDDGYGSRYRSSSSGHYRSSGGHYRKHYQGNSYRNSYAGGYSGHRNYSSRRSYSPHRGYAGHRYSSGRGCQPSYGHRYYRR